MLLYEESLGSLIGKFSSQNGESSRNKIMHLERMLSKMATPGKQEPMGRLFMKNPEFENLVTLSL